MEERGDRVEHRITKYPLEQGALEIEYIEEFFGEYKRRKTAVEIVSGWRTAITDFDDDRAATG